MDNLLGWIVSWPSRPKDEQDGDIRDYHGLAKIIGAQGDHFIARVIDDTFEGEPPYHISICLHDESLRYFPSEKAYEEWVGFWRSQPDTDPSPPNLLHLVPKGRG